MASKNLELFISVARQLRPLLDEFVFLGGCTTALLVTDPAATEVRPTYDVDAIVEITSYAEYRKFSQKLRELNFTEDTSEGAPICRWRTGDMKLDVMPIDEKILGFSNRWYREAMDKAEEVELEPGLRVRVVTAPYFLATKFEAFRGRGAGDYYASHDLEDVITVVDGRPYLTEEVLSAGDAVREFVRSETQGLLSDPDFLNAFPGYLPPDPASQKRVPLLLKRLELLAWFGTERRVEGSPIEAPDPLREQLHARVVVTPISPPTAASLEFQIVEIQAETVSLRRFGGSEQLVTVPRQRIQEVVELGAHRPKLLVLNGRMQWTEPHHVWQFFPEPPTSAEQKALGFGKPSALQDPAATALARSITQHRGEAAWRRISDIPRWLGNGWEIVYDSDGQYFRIPDRTGDLILVMKR